MLNVRIPGTKMETPFCLILDTLFAHQGDFEIEDLVGYAAELGLDVERFAHDLDDDETHARIRADVVSAEASGARGTPTFFVNGRRHVGAYDASTLRTSGRVSSAD